MPKYKLIKRDTGDSHPLTEKGTTNDFCIDLLESEDLYSEYKIEVIPDLVRQNSSKNPDGSDIKILAGHDEVNGKEKSFLKLSEGDRDSVRRGFKELVLRKSGWILRDCTNKALNEIHISLRESEYNNQNIERAKIGKSSAIERAKFDVLILRQFKEILKNSVIGEDFNVTFEIEDQESILNLVDKLSIENSEVETLKAEIDRLNRIIKTK